MTSTHIERFLMTMCIMATLIKVPTSGMAAPQRQITTPEGVSALLYTPQGYNAGTSNLPLLIFLHGDEDISEDPQQPTFNSKQMSPPRLIAENKWDKHLPFIVVSPRLIGTKSQRPGWTTQNVYSLVNHIKANFRVDPYRIYITGVGSGATAALKFAAAYPDMVAALLTVSGVADVSYSCALKNVPTWIFHSSAYSDVPTGDPLAMISAMRNCNPGGAYSPRLSMINSTAYDLSGQVYDRSLGFNVYEWMLRFRKFNTTNKPPMVSAGADRIINANGSIQYFTCEYFDWDGEIKEVSWKQIEGSPVGMSGASSALLSVKAPSPGRYTFEVSVTDDKGSIATDRVTLKVLDKGLHGPPTLVLLDGKTNREVGVLRDGAIINKSALGISSFNIKAVGASSTAKVIFSINHEEVSRVASGPGPFTLLKPSANVAWKPQNGTYVICASTWTSDDVSVSTCHRVSVTSAGVDAVKDQWLPGERLSIKAIDDVLIANRSSGIQWMHDGRDIPGATGSVYKPVIPGEYFVRVTERTVRDISNSVFIEAGSAFSPLNSFDVVTHGLREYLLVSGESVPSRAEYKIIRLGGELVQEGALREDFKIPLEPGLQRGEYVVMVRTKAGDQSRKVQL